MSEQANPAEPLPNRTLRRLAKIALVTLFLLFLFLFMVAGVGSGPIEACIALVFGWIGFLKRTLPQISWNWDLVGMGILCSAIILFLAHRSLNWITKNIGSARGLSWTWPWKWTVCGLIALALLFLIGMSVGGAAHQIGWIASSDEPSYERKPRFLQDMTGMSELDTILRQALLEENTVEQVRKYMWSADAEERHRSRSYQQKSLMQSFHILLVVGPDQKVLATILFPRDAERQARIGGQYTADGDIRRVPAKDLPELIRGHQAKIIAL